MRRRLGSLGTRLAAAMVVLVVVTAVATAVSGLVLLRRADEAAARRALAMLADSVAAQVDAGADAAQVVATIGTTTVRVAVVSGTKVSGEGIAKAATNSEIVSSLGAGKAVSQRRTLQGAVYLLEGRPTRSGGVVLVQRRTDASSLLDQILPEWVAVVAGIGVLAAAAGLLLAWWVSRPIRGLARAATAISAGERRPVLVTGPSEVTALADDINRLSAELARSEARQREFLVSVSHDLRTPLATMAGYAEALASGAIPAPEIAGVGSVLVAESSRLGRMVSDLLDLARAEAGELAFSPELLDVREVAAAAAVVWADRCAGKGLDFRTETTSDVLLVSIDPHRLRQALDGLLDNAVRVTPAGRPVVLQVAGGDGTAELSVRDGGPGLTDDDLAVAFDRGALHDRYRGRRQVGTGVGLSLVDRLVTRQGGTVTAGHSPEGGASFTVTIPLAPEQVEGTEARARTLPE